MACAPTGLYEAAAAASVSLLIILEFLLLGYITILSVGVLRTVQVAFAAEKQSRSWSDWSEYLLQVSAALGDLLESHQGSHQMALETLVASELSMARQDLCTQNQGQAPQPDRYTKPALHLSPFAAIQPVTAGPISSSVTTKPGTLQAYPITITSPDHGSATGPTAPSTPVKEMEPFDEYALMLDDPSSSMDVPSQVQLDMSSSSRQCSTSSAQLPPLLPSEDPEIQSNLWVAHQSQGFEPRTSASSVTRGQGQTSMSGTHSIAIPQRPRLVAGPETMECYGSVPTNADLLEALTNVASAGNAYHLSFQATRAANSSNRIYARSTSVTNLERQSSLNTNAFHRLSASSTRLPAGYAKKGWKATGRGNRSTPNMQARLSTGSASSMLQGAATAVVAAQQFDEFCKTVLATKAGAAVSVTVAAESLELDSGLRPGPSRGSGGTARSGPKEAVQFDTSTTGFSCFGGLFRRRGKGSGRS